LPFLCEVGNESWCPEQIVQGSDDRGAESVGGDVVGDWASSVQGSVEIASIGP